MHKPADGGSHCCGKGCLNRLWAGVTLLAMVFAEGCSTPSTSSITTAEPDVIQLDKTKDILASADETVVVTLDAVYQARKRYRGITLSRLLKSNGHDPAIMAPDTVIQFVCKDGYNPVTTLAVVIRDKAFLATGDLDAPPDQTWIQFKSGTSPSDLGQFYLVWPHVMAVGDGHPWPYGIIALRIGTANTLLGPALPRLERFQPGFDLFRANCIMCHSINGIGGTIGIDLNVPRNVFEYWQADKLPSMVANPASFRRNAKMPSFEGLGAQGISNVLAYVKHMKAHKLQPPP